VLAVFFFFFAHFLSFQSIEVEKGGGFNAHVLLFMFDCFLFFICDIICDTLVIIKGFIICTSRAS
jgi:hypothetical protein